MIQDAKYSQNIKIWVLVSFSYLYQKHFIVGAMDGLSSCCGAYFFDNTAIGYILSFLILFFSYSLNTIIKGKFIHVSPIKTSMGWGETPN